MSLLLSLLTLALFALFLCFPQVTVTGASAGLLLWFQTLLPTLLPTMILADFIQRMEIHKLLVRWLATPFSYLFGTSPLGSYNVIIGLLCGYPMGAKTAASLLQYHRITKKEAHYLLSFTNQPSPMFLTGVLCAGLFLSKGLTTVTLILLAWISVYGSAILVSITYRCLHHLWGDPLYFSEEKETQKHNKTTDRSPLSQLEASMMTSFEVMVKIGGYMMLFSIFEQWVMQLDGLSIQLQVLILGLMEMTTGIGHMAQNIPFPWSFGLCIGACAFGGACGTAQTANLIQGTNYPILHYIVWKILQGILATLLAVLLLCFLGISP